MIKSQYKNIFLLVITLLIIPNIVLAAWWNPLGWFNNWTFSQHIDNEVEVLKIDADALGDKEFVGDSATVIINNQYELAEEKQVLFNEENKSQSDTIKKEELQTEQFVILLKELLLKKEQEKLEEERREVDEESYLRDLEKGNLIKEYKNKIEQIDNEILELNEKILNTPTTANPSFTNANPGLHSQPYINSGILKEYTDQISNLENEKEKLYLEHIKIINSD
jgi:hypothetical protein